MITSPASGGDITLAVLVSASPIMKYGKRLFARNLLGDLRINMKAIKNSDMTKPTSPRYGLFQLLTKSYNSDIIPNPTFNH